MNRHRLHCAACGKRISPRGRLYSFGPVALCTPCAVYHWPRLHRRLFWGCRHSECEPTHHGALILTAAQHVSINQRQENKPCPT